MRLRIISIFLAIIFLHGHGEEKPKNQTLKIRKATDIGIISTSSSPFAKLHDIPIRAVTFGDGFWTKRLEVNIENGIPTFLNHLKEVGALDKLLKNKARGNSDADLAKWMEAVSFVLQSEDAPYLRKIIESIIDDILVSNADGGYFKTRYLDNLPDGLANLKSRGHLYCLGHLIQAAIAYYRATGEKKLLDIFAGYIDNVVELFGTGKQQCWAGHPEIEMSLIELYRITNDKKYLNFAGYLLNGVDLRKIEKSSEINFEHSFTGIPFKSRKIFTDHAVCAMYASCAAADYYLETGDKEMWQTLEYLWKDLTRYKMYITGGVGSRPPEEAIGDRYELPNAAVSINGEKMDVVCNPGSYCEVRRIWKKKDRVQIEFDMPVRVISANPRVRENAGSAAIQRGPIIYCLESLDHKDVSIFDIVLPLDSANYSSGFEAKFEPNLLGGIVTIGKDALAYDTPLTNAELYSYTSFPKTSRSLKIKAIPYYAWANRGLSEMEVWIPRAD